jgi:hypothetical protein
MPTDEETVVVWPEPQEITVRCPFCRGATMVPFEINGWVPTIEGKMLVRIAQQTVEHKCPNV